MSEADSVAAKRSARPVRIPVVEDHDGYRRLASEVLRQSGFEVTETENADTALLAIGADPSIDLLVTDIVMPGRLDGWSLAARAVTLRPTLRVLYTIGADTVLPQAGAAPGYGPLLPKPWTPQQLVVQVARLLGHTPGPRRRRPQSVPITGAE